MIVVDVGPSEQWSPITDLSIYVRFPMSGKMYRSLTLGYKGMYSKVRRAIEVPYDFRHKVCNKIRDTFGQEIDINGNWHLKPKVNLKITDKKKRPFVNHYISILGGSNDEMLDEPPNM